MEKQCEYCGAEAVIWFGGEMLCDNCWKGVKIDLEDKKKWKQQKD